MNNKLIIIIFSLLLLIGSQSNSYSQVTVTKMTDLSFGAVMVPTAGSITIAADQNGSISKTGGVVLLDFDPTSSAYFSVKVDRTIVGAYLDIPSFINLTGPNNSSIRINNITNTNFLRWWSGVGAGTYSLYVGGTVNLTPNMTGGTYTGSFKITVNHW